MATNRQNKDGFFPSRRRANGLPSRSQSQSMDRPLTLRVGSWKPRGKNKRPLLSDEVKRARKTAKQKTRYRLKAAELKRKATARYWANKDRTPSRQRERYQTTEGRRPGSAREAKRRTEPTTPRVVETTPLPQPSLDPSPSRVSAAVLAHAAQAASDAAHVEKEAIAAAVAAAAAAVAGVAGREMMSSPQVHVVNHHSAFYGAVFNGTNTGCNVSSGPLPSEVEAEQRAAQSPHSPQPMLYSDLEEEAQWREEPQPSRAEDPTHDLLYDPNNRDESFTSSAALALRADGFLNFE
jgi:hypothetical protein